MRAMEARRLYFEDFVEYEHNLRRLCRRLFPAFETGGSGLKTIINKISTHTDMSGEDISLIRRNKNTRNWLAHSSRNKIVPLKVLEDGGRIEEVNTHIINILR